jgi:hypothetical protein
MTVERHANYPGPSILILQSSCPEEFCGMIVVDALSIDDKVEMFHVAVSLWNFEQQLHCVAPVALLSQISVGLDLNYILHIHYLILTTSCGLHRDV